MPLDPCLEIVVIDEELNSWSSLWHKSLVVHLLGIKVLYSIFSTKEDYKHALFEGPWMIVDNYLLVQWWRLFFLPNMTKVTKVAVCIIIPKLPLELYNNRFLWRIGSKLGTMLKVSILFPNWDHVEEVVKNHIWVDVMVNFIYNQHFLLLNFIRISTCTNSLLS
uniref:DUF4283 domain-containing protein n=1 Tax=Cajanus cajan TaxID=3821 RepID=A0A151RL31_CAJCA|nr:hypothetical protein KK1_035278 [Cajanus cajan]